LKQDVNLQTRMDSICLRFLDTDDLEDLVELIELIQNALANRVQITFTAAERWNATVDARGIGLDRVISAADAPLKCGLGMLRRVMNEIVKRGEPQKTREQIDKDNRRRIGGASKISYHPRCFSKRLVIGDTPNIFIASVDLNLTHLTRPRAFYIHLHETAHLISYLLRDKEGCKHKDFECAVYNKCCHKKRSFEENELNEIYLERYQEIFAEMLVHQFVFENDTKLFFRNYIVNYSLDPIGFSRDDEQSFVRMLEVLVRGFLASDPFRVPDVYSDSEGQLRKPTMAMMKKALSRFWMCVEDAGSFLYDFWRLWFGEKKSEVKKCVDEQFTRVYKESYHPVCCMWEDVKEVHRIVTDETYPKGHETTEQLISQINKGFDEGRPVVRVKFKVNNGEELVGEEKRLDPLFIVSSLLRRHIETLYGDINTANNVVYLRRRTNGQPNLQCLRPNEAWNRRLLDRNFNGIAAADPTTREKSMKNRIAMVKTLWDISTTLRARRMKDILSLVMHQIV